jgi:hypothetical protein
MVIHIVIYGYLRHSSNIVWDLRDQTAAGQVNLILHWGFLDHRTIQELGNVETLWEWEIPKGLQDWETSYVCWFINLWTIIAPIN